MKNRIRAFPLYVGGLLAAALPLQADDSMQPDAASLLAGQAQASVAAFASALKSELSSAMQAGGPLQAIEVCNTKAPAIAREISLQQGVQVSRVSEGNRNPGNAPNDWQATVLQQFRDRLAAGENGDNLAWQDISEADGVREFRFMKAIPTVPMCLACHGQAIAPPVAQKIAELYPGDKATGYSEGDLRGAFVVTRQVE